MLPEGGDFPAPSSGEDMSCLRCSRGIHRQHPGRCRDCHQARGLCHACYWQSRQDGTIAAYPPLRRGPRVRRDCPHGGIHDHGTPAAYIQDRCRCTPCCTAKTAQLTAWRKRRHLHGPDTVDPTGTMRRVQALAAIGWSLTEVARRLGTEPCVVQAICRGDRTRVYRRTAERVRAVYDQLSMTPRIGTDERSRISVTMTLSLAKANCWAPPLAWDDDTIEDPAATPYVGGTEDELVDEMAVERFIGGDHTVPLNHAERVEVTRRMLHAGHRRNHVMSLLRLNGTNFARLRDEALTDMETAA